MTKDFEIPRQIEAAIETGDKSVSITSVHNIQQAISSVRSALTDLFDKQNRGAWIEVLSFSLSGDRSNSSPWGTYFGPMGSGTNKEGEIVYFPDIADIDEKVIEHWVFRAGQLTHPILKARYADLAWDISGYVEGVRRDPDMARIAIDSYMSSVLIVSERHEKFMAVLRALDLACLLNDKGRIDDARASLLELHQHEMAIKGGMWWWAFDRLISDARAGLTKPELDQLIADAERVIKDAKPQSATANFDAYRLKEAADRLINYFMRQRLYEQVKRLHQEIAEAFEQVANQSDALLASALLQTSVNAYRDAGMSEESKRVRILMQEKIGDAGKNMSSIEGEYSISFDDMESFLNQIVTDDLGSTFLRIASNFLPSRKAIEKQLIELLDKAPLVSRIPKTIMADDHVVGRIDSVEVDPFGRLIDQTHISYSFSQIWLRKALERAIEVHGIVPEHFVSWANRSAIFEDVTLIIEGVRGWYAGDYLKAVHLLVPQIEAGLRNIVGQLGCPTTKADRRIQDISICITMGDILYAEEIANSLSPDFVLHFQALFADPRGMNLRNRVAHGLIKPELANESTSDLLLLTLLILGLWREFAEHRH